jgi:DnaK suppressor protein
MTKHENIAKVLKARLSELTNRVVEIDTELRKPLSADLEEQATDLENQEALEAIENSEIHEIRQIQEALKRISEGTYGICAHCGEDIDPKRRRHVNAEAIDLDSLRHRAQASSRVRLKAGRSKGYFAPTFVSSSSGRSGRSPDWLKMKSSSFRLNNPRGPGGL